MNAQTRVQEARQDFLKYLNNERANLRNRSVTDSGAIFLLEQVRYVIDTMQQLGVIAPNEATEIEHIITCDIAQSYTLSAPADGRINDWDLSTINRECIEIWWGARFRETTRQWIVPYTITKDVWQKHEILDAAEAWLKVCEILNILPQSEYQQTTLRIQKERQELTGGNQ